MKQVKLHLSTRASVQPGNTAEARRLYGLVLTLMTMGMPCSGLLILPSRRSSSSRWA